MFRTFNTFSFTNTLTVGLNTICTGYNQGSRFMTTINDKYISNDDIDYYFDTLLNLCGDKLNFIEYTSLSIFRSAAKNEKFNVPSKFLSNDVIFNFTNNFNRNYANPNYIEYVKTTSNIGLNKIFSNFQNFIKNNTSLMYNFELRDFMIKSTSVIRDKVKKLASDDLDSLKFQTI